MHYVKLRYILGQLNGVFGSAEATLCLLPQANPEAFLAGTYAVKSPVIKQLEGLLWGDLAWRGPVPIWLQSGFTRAPAPGIQQL